MPWSDPFDPPMPRKLRKGSLSGKVHVTFQLGFACAYAWLCFHFPASGVALLFLTGVAVVMTISEVRPLHKAVWLALVFAFVFLENKAMTRDREEAKNDTDSAFATANLTLTDIILLSGNVDRYREEIRKAQNNRDFTLVDKIQKKQKQAQLQLALTTAPGVVTAMQQLAEQFSHDDEEIERESSGASVDARRVFDQRRNDLAQKYVAKLRPIMTTADYLRQELLREEPSTQQTEEDKEYSAIFARIVAGQPIRWNEMTGATTYLGMLVKKLSTPFITTVH
jgi:hypothetical protein